MALRACRNNVAQQRLRPLDVDGEIIVDKENRHLALFGAGARLQQQEFVDDAFVRTEANRVPKKSSHGAELAAVRASSSRFNRNNSKRSPAFSDFLQQSGRRLRHQIELLEVD